MTIKQLEADKNLDLPIPVIGIDRHSNIWLWLTVPIAILLAIAAGGGVFRSSLYRDNPSLLAQAIGQDQDILHRKNTHQSCEYLSGRHSLSFLFYVAQRDCSGPDRGTDSSKHPRERDAIERGVRA